MFIESEVGPAELLWFRGNARIDGGWVRIDVPQPYTLMQRDLMTATMEFVRLRTEEDAVSFASAYGLLVGDPDDGPYQEAFDHWREESLSMGAVVWMYMALGKVADGDELGMADLKEAVVIARSRFDAGLPDATSDAEVVDQARWLVGGIMTGKLADVGLALAPESVVALGGRVDRFAFASNPATLLHAMYVAMAGVFARHDDLRHCLECGRPFVVDDPRQRYCRTLCSTRARKKRFSERQRESAAPVDGTL